MVLRKMIFSPKQSPIRDSPGLNIYFLVPRSRLLALGFYYSFTHVHFTTTCTVTLGLPLYTLFSFSKTKCTWPLPKRRVLISSSQNFRQGMSDIPNMVPYCHVGAFSWWALNFYLHPPHNAVAMPYLPITS